MSWINIENKLVGIDSRDTVDSLLPRYCTDEIDAIFKYQYRNKEAYKLSPVPILPFTQTSIYLDKDYESWREKHQTEEPKFNFHCSLAWRRRPFATKVRAVMINREDTIITTSRKNSFEEYMSAMSQSRLVVSAPSVGDFTGREPDAMAVKVPFFRFGYVNQTYNPLIPNKHFILIKGFNELKKFVNRAGDLFHDKVWLESYENIREEAFKWYQTNSTVVGSFDLAVKILEQNTIL
jgi:hypothetical protein